MTESKDDQTMMPSLSISSTSSITPIIHPPHKLELNLSDAIEFEIGETLWDNSDDEDDEDGDEYESAEEEDPASQDASEMNSDDFVSSQETFFDSSQKTVEVDEGGEAVEEKAPNVKKTSKTTSKSRRKSKPKLTKEERDLIADGEGFIEYSDAEENSQKSEDEFEYQGFYSFRGSLVSRKASKQSAKDANELDNGSKKSKKGKKEKEGNAKKNLEWAKKLVGQINDSKPSNGPFFTKELDRIIKSIASKGDSKCTDFIKDNIKESNSKLVEHWDGHVARINLSNTAKEERKELDKCTINLKTWFEDRFKILSSKTQDTPRRWLEKFKSFDPATVDANLFLNDLYFRSTDGTESTNDTATWGEVEKAFEDFLNRANAVRGNEESEKVIAMCTGYFKRCNIPAMFSWQMDGLELLTKWGKQHKKAYQVIQALRDLETKLFGAYKRWRSCGTTEAEFALVVKSLQSVDPVIGNPSFFTVEEIKALLQGNVVAVDEPPKSTTSRKRSRPASSSKALEMSKEKNTSKPPAPSSQNENEEKSGTPVSIDQMPRKSQHFDEKVFDILDFSKIGNSKLMLYMQKSS